MLILCAAFFTIPRFCFLFTVLVSLVFSFYVAAAFSQLQHVGSVFTVSTHVRCLLSLSVLAVLGSAWAAFHGFNTLTLFIAAFTVSPYLQCFAVPGQRFLSFLVFVVSSQFQCICCVLHRICSVFANTNLQCVHTCALFVVFCRACVYSSHFGRSGS